ncbi:MAG TPA: GspH/FimT family pseudopilin [Telluria sp.]|jgi:type IV fimbrial biogenesis protein FimT
MLIMRTRGFTLLEMMVGVLIVSLLLAVGIPSFSGWIQNVQSRSAAEAILNGMQVARTEAVRRNMPVRFNLTDADGKIAFVISCVRITATCPNTPLQERNAAEGGGNARVGISNDATPDPTPVGYYGTAIAAGTELPAGVTFDGLGRTLVANAGKDITRVDISNAKDPTARRYVIKVGTGGEVRMCDPALAFSANPQGCS